jgi:hypothetical protein
MIADRKRLGSSGRDGHPNNEKEENRAPLTRDNSTVNDSTAASAAI